MLLKIKVKFIIASINLNPLKLKKAWRDSEQVRAMRKIKKKCLLTDGNRKQIPWSARQYPCYDELNNLVCYILFYVLSVIKFRDCLWLN